MMATPNEWLAEFQANTGVAETGSQNQPQIIGLSNGNILIAWDELSEGVGSADGTDIVGVILDAEGNVVRAPFQINDARNFDDEGDFDIAATNDGGFIVAYVDADLTDTDRSSIIWERFDSNGDAVSFSQVADENIAGDNLRNPQIALDLTDNSFMLTYTDEVGVDTDINAVSVTFTNVAGTTFNVSSEFAAAQNSNDVDDQGDIAILSNGNYVTVNREFDGAVPGIDIRILQPDGTYVADRQNFATGNNAAPRVTGLANGGFVVVWNQTDANNGDILGRVYDSAGNLVTTTFTIAGTSAGENEPDVVALPDGGFIVFWDDESFGLRARAFHADGATNGAVFDVAEGNAADSDVGVTADGRILFAWQENNEMQASIWDGRNSPIEASDYQAGATNFLDNTGPVTSLIGGAEMNGTANEDELLGNAGNDTIRGGDSADTLSGGAGFDLIFGNNGDDYIDGGSENDDLRGSAGNDTILGGFGRDVIRGNSGDDDIRGGAGGDTLAGGLDNDEIRGASGDDAMKGEAGNDLISSGIDDDLAKGNEGADTLLGGDGNDSLQGNPGDDELYGQAGNDDLRGGNDNDTLDGGSGNDTLRGNSGDDVFVYAPGADDDLIIGFEGGAGAGDVIDLSVYNGVFDNFADVLAAASDVGGNVVIDLGGGDSITLLNTTEASLNADDFLF
ncbi:calcium-binding protein [Marinicaulis aureus]